MKKHTLAMIPFVILMTACLTLTSCNVFFNIRENGPLTTRDFTYTEFKSLDIGSAFEVEIEQADTYSMQITAHENVLNNIKITRIGETLKIGLQWPWFSFGSRDLNLKAKITMPELKELTLSGATEGTVRGFKTNDDFKVRLSGASDLDMDMETGSFTGIISGASELTARMKNTESDLSLSGSSEATLDLITGNLVYKSSGASKAKGHIEATGTQMHLSGSSRIEANGTGGDLTLAGSGASDFRLIEFAVNDADISLNGASYAEIYVNGKLDIELSGASKLIYDGNPILGNTTDISGASTFERR